MLKPGDPLIRILVILSTHDAVSGELNPPFYLLSFFPMATLVRPHQDTYVIIL